LQAQTNLQLVYKGNRASTDFHLRTITLVVALATLGSNVFSSVLFSQLPDDPYHLASNFGWYLHFANILSVFGFLGSLRVCSSPIFLPSPFRNSASPYTRFPRKTWKLHQPSSLTKRLLKYNANAQQQHALSIAIFSNYLLLDTIVCAIPRMLLLGLVHTLSAPMCTSPPASPFSQDPITLQAPSSQAYTTDASSPASQWELLTSRWTLAGCYNIVQLAQLALAAGVIAGTVLQFVGALYVRDYARELWIREIRDEVADGRRGDHVWLPGVDEEGYLDDVVGREKL
jgi:hypothetical protein